MERTRAWMQVSGRKQNMNCRDEHEPDIRRPQHWLQPVGQIIAHL